MTARSVALGVGRGVALAVSRTSQGPAPAALFANGEAGVWFDPSDLSTLFQDAAGTTPVTASGQPVGLMLDKSGNGNHASQVTDANRPTLQVSGGRYYLSCDGMNDALATASIDFTSSDQVYGCFGLEKLSDAAVAAFLEFSPSGADGIFAFFAPATAAQASVTWRSRGTALAINTVLSLPAPNKSVFTVRADISTPLNGISVNGGAEAVVATSQGTGNYGSFPLYLFSRGGTTLPFTGSMYGIIIRLGAPPASDLADAVERFMAGKTGVTI